MSRLLRVTTTFPWGKRWPRSRVRKSMQSCDRAVASTANFCYLSPMIVRPDQVIAGRPAKDIRKLLREIRHLQVSSAYVRDVLGARWTRPNRS